METKLAGHRDINLGLETLKVHEGYFARKDKAINEKVDSLEDLNELLSEFAKFTATLNSGKSNNKLDFTNHALRPTVDKIYLKHPELFAGFNNIYTDWDKDRIERVVFGSDPIVKQLTSEVSQMMTKLQVDYTDQTEITRILGKIIEEISQHVKSILSKLSKIS